MYCAAFLLLGLAVVQNTLAENVFKVPPPGNGSDEDLRDNKVYTIGEEVTFRWSSDYQEFDVLIWNKEIDTELGARPSAWLVDNSSSKNFTWKVTYSVFPEGADLSLPIYYLALYQAGNENRLTTSHYFNITAGAATTSSTSTTATAAATSAATSAISSEISTSTSTTTNPPEQTSSSTQAKGLSRGGVAGVAIAATLAVVASLGGVGYFLWRRRSRNKAAGGNDNAGGDVVPNHESHQPYTAEWKPVPQSEPAELEHKAVRTPEPVELSAEGR